MNHQEETIERIKILVRKRVMLLDRLVAPARAAVNAMKDAKMDRTADPLAEALFQIDAITAELSSIPMEELAEAMFTLLRRESPE